VGTGFSFEVVNATDYDDLRPAYAPAAAAWVLERGELAARSLVVDLAAGTGRLSRRFADLGCEVVAVEPARNMRAVLEERLPGVRVLEGTAESIPLRDGAADALVVGNAFHHFDPGPAVEEIRRVLRPGGAFALFWARPELQDPSRDPLMRGVDEAVDRIRAASPIAEAYERWSDTQEPIEGFTPFERRSFPIAHVLPSARLADLYATSSDVASLSDDARAALLDRIRGLASELPEVLELPARSDVDLCRRTGAA
jgi:SAM-dependent methyltransferase